MTQTISDPGSTVRTLEKLGIPALFCSSPKHDIVYANMPLATLLDCSGSALVGQQLAKVQHLKNVADLLENGDDKVHILPLGKSAECRIHIHKAASIGWLVVFYDASDYHEQEKQLRDVLYMVAHDLKTPISVIRSYAELVENLGEVNAQQAQFLGRIKLAADGMSRLVHDLMDLTWIDTNAPLETERSRLAYIVQSAIDNLQRMADAKQVKISFSADDTLPMVQADPYRLRRVVHNLLSNAIRYSPSGATVEIEVIKSDVSRLAIKVTDHGPGIDDEHLPHIFERFYRGKDVEDHFDGPGSGLGLAIVQAIVDKHGGTIEVKTESGTGTTFSIYLPVSET